MNPTLRTALFTGLALVAFSVVGTALLSGTYGLTRETIAKSEEAEKLHLIAQTLPEGSYDNNLVAAAHTLAPDALLGTKRPSQAYTATLAGEPVAVVLEAVAPDGYAGEIHLLVGIHADGRLSGVRVTTHKETPGLGDYIEIKKHRWIRQFDGASLADTPAEQWRVRKDGGRFDYLAGATITPRAVVKAVHRALQYFEQHRAELLKPEGAPQP